MTPCARRHGLVAALAWLALAAWPAEPVAAQTRSALVPVGEPVLQQGLRISAGYIPGTVSVEPPAAALDSPSVLHLQLEVDATKGNPYGFDADDSVPYLRLPFAMLHESGRRIEGMLAPMVSRDGFHYGASVALPVTGAYTLSVEIRPPEGLARHTDTRTGVAAWWAPFTLTWTLRYPDR
jgi:uncharacterized protein involved in high-affinity Fe2+ transport